MNRTFTLPNGDTFSLADLDLVSELRTGYEFSYDVFLKSGKSILVHSRREPYISMDAVKDSRLFLLKAWNDYLEDDYKIKNK
jgi:hypothetical protein